MSSTKDTVILFSRVIVLPWPEAWGSRCKKASPSKPPAAKLSKTWARPKERFTSKIRAVVRAQYRSSCKPLTLSRLCDSTELRTGRKMSTTAGRALMSPVDSRARDHRSQSISGLTAGISAVTGSLDWWW